MDRIDKTSDANFNLTCIFCGRTDGIQAWPHRNPAGQMVGMIFACYLCQEHTKNIGFQMVLVDEPSVPVAKSGPGPTHCGKCPEHEQNCEPCKPSAPAHPSDAASPVCPDCDGTGRTGDSRMMGGVCPTCFGTDQSSAPAGGK